MQVENEPETKDSSSNNEPTVEPTETNKNNVQLQQFSKTKKSQSSITAPIQQPSAFVANRIDANASNSSLLTARALSQQSLLTTTVDPPLIAPPRSIPFTIILRVLTGGSSYVHSFFFLLVVNGLIQGFVQCFEIVCFVPMLLWGLVTFFSSLWKLHLLRNGVACIPHVVEKERGTTCNLCGYDKKVTLTPGLQTGSGCISFGGWQVNFGRFKREKVRITTLRHHDPEKNVEATFLFSSLPYRNSVVLYDPRNPKRYVHVKDLPFELKPDEKEGRWVIQRQYLRWHIVLVLVALVFWGLFIAAVAWMALFIQNQPHILFSAIKAAHPEYCSRYSYLS